MAAHLAAVISSITGRLRREPSVEQTADRIAHDLSRQGQVLAFTPLITGYATELCGHLCASGPERLLNAYREYVAGLSGSLVEAAARVDKIRTQLGVIFGCQAHARQVLYTLCGLAEGPVFLNSFIPDRLRAWKLEKPEECPETEHADNRAGNQD